MILKNLFFPKFTAGGQPPLSVISVGLQEDQNKIVRPKKYLGYHLMLTRRGAGELEFMGKTYPLAQNAVFFIDKTAGHSYRPVGGRWFTEWICFDCPKSLMHGLGFKDAVIIPKAHEIYTKYHTLIMSQAELMDDGAAYRSSALLYELLCELCCFMRCEPDGLSTSAAKHISAAQEYIKNNYMHNIGLPEISAAAGVSKQYLCRVFRERLGTTPYGYLVLCRINKAKQLLQDRGVPIGEISAQCGFSDFSYFCAAFKKSEGMSPGSFRNQI